MPEQKQNRVIVNTLLVVMLICQLFIITRFSAQPAQKSSAESDGVLSKVIEVIMGAEKEKIDPLVYHSMHSLLRKAAHFTLFLILGFICAMLGDELCSTKKSRMYLAVFICGFIVACLDETHQYFVPGRSAQISDVCVDFSGIIAASILKFVLKKVFKC